MAVDEWQISTGTYMAYRRIRGIHIPACKGSCPVPSIFNDILHDRLGTWPLAYIPYGAADYGEIISIAHTVNDGDDGAFHQTWTDAADRLMAEGELAQSQGRRPSASEAFLKAACFYGTSYRPFFGAPLAPRLISGSRRQTEAFNRGLALRQEPVEPMRIPFESGTLPAYIVPAQGMAGKRRPLLILTNGYDGSISDLYFASAVAASRRGYHCLIFDGPGQGEMLIEHGMPLRPDWETVIGAVVDFALTLPYVDQDRIALSGWSLGGYLAPRAASMEHRLAACIADPAQICPANGFRAFARKLGVDSGQATRLSQLPQDVLDRMEEIIMHDRLLRWSVVQRGYWVNGSSNLRDYLLNLEGYTLAGRVDQIRCPTLVTCAQNDPLASDSVAFHDALRCPRKLLEMSSRDGAGDHCEMGNRSLLNRKVLDWLDDVLGQTP